MKKFKLMSMLTLVLLLGAGQIACHNVKDSDLQATASQIVANIQNTGNIKVSVTDKVATLSGNLENDATKLKIEASVLAIDGIESVINNIQLTPPALVYVEPVVEKKSDQLIVATRKGKLNVHNKPGVQELVIAVVDHGETLTLVEKTSDAWWRIRTEGGLEGYSNAPYLEEQ